MSGGAVLNAQGRLIGIHGQGETDAKMSEQEVIRLAGQALAIKQSAEAYFYRAYAKGGLGDKQGAIADYNQAIAINPQAAKAYYNRGKAKSDLGDKQGEIVDYNQAIAINPQYAKAYNNRGVVKSDLGDKQGACADFKKSVSLGNQSTAQWLQSEGGAWCRNMP